jgi:hypothetical protein
MLGFWLTAGHLGRQIVQHGTRGQAVLGTQLDPEPLTGGLERIKQGSNRHSDGPTASSLASGSIAQGAGVDLTNASRCKASVMARKGRCHHPTISLVL